MDIPGQGSPVAHSGGAELRALHVTILRGIKFPQRLTVGTQAQMDLTAELPSTVSPPGFLLEESIFILHGPALISPLLGTFPIF